MSLNKLLSGKVSMEYRSLFIACLNLAKSYSLLHLRGLCYKDVSINNFSSQAPVIF